jgi:type I restriction enzyme S subunit
MIHANQEQVQELRRLKRGLMQDLLTGRVRTRDKDIKILDEVAAHG